MDNSPSRSASGFFDQDPSYSPNLDYRARSSSSASSRPSYSRSSSFTSLMPMMDRYGEEWGSGATTLLDVVETFFDSRLDLMGRRLKAQSARLKTRTLELIPKGLRTPGGGGSTILDDLAPRLEGRDGLDVSESRESRDLRERRGEKYRKEVEREVERIKVKLAAKVTHLSGTWRSAQIIRTREKFSFFFGVLSLAFTCILYGAAPEWLPLAYTVQSAFYLPTRVWSYKRKAFHYFLFDLCYFVNVLDLVWIWLMPHSTVLFICSYLLTMGPLASAIITWRNSLVFHSMDKVTSLFIHMYPPLVLTVIRHSYVDAESRYPGLAHVSDYSWWKQILLAGVPYILWQAAYYKFISIDRKSKIESGQRQNSFHYLLNDKRGPIGKALKGINPTNRERWFIFGQLIYSIVFMIPAAALYIHSATASAIYLTVVFATSVWNGGNFYIEVFGRKFERELEKLRREMELASATGAPSSTQTSAPSTPYADGQSEYHTDAADDLANSPLALPSAGHAVDMEVPDLTLDKAVEEVDREGKKSR